MNSTRECELTIGTTCWRMTIYPNRSWVLDTRLDGAWEHAVSGSNDVDGMQEALEWWRGVDGDGVLELVTPGMPPGAVAALERFAEVMVVQ